MKIIQFDFTIKFFFFYIFCNAFKKNERRFKIKKGKNVGGYGFSTQDANRIATAIWMSYKGAPSAILSIADELNTAYKAEEASLSAGQQQLLKGFVNSGYISPEDYKAGKLNNELESISKVVTNTRDIAAEMMEYGKGDYEIQRDIGVFEPTEEIAQSEIDFRKAADDYNSIKAHVSFDGVLGNLNATDTIDIYAYVLMDQGTASYRAANGTMITLFKINND